MHLVYNEFKSVMQQKVVVERLLPIPRLDTAPTDAAAAPIEYLYEPEPTKLFAHLIPSHVEVQVFKALLESNAAFFAAQMTAMDAATRNSGEMIDSLTSVHEQGPPGGDHARDHRGRERRAGAAIEPGSRFTVQGSGLGSGLRA